MESGSRIAHYELVGRLGEGAVGVVWKARDTRDGSVVALKLLRPERLDETSRARFKREAKAALGMSHPNVVSVRDVGDDWIAFDYVGGGTLEDLLRGAGRLEWR